jgi:hypothetical protein
MWADSRDVAHLVASIAGARPNGLELIDLMVRLSELRGHTDVLSGIESLETSEYLSSILKQVERDVRKSVQSDMEKIVGHVRTMVHSLNLSLSRVADPLKGVRVAAGQEAKTLGEVKTRAELEGAVASDPLVALQEAVRQVQGSCEVDTAAVVTKVGDAALAELVLAFAPLRKGLAAVRLNIDEMRGFVTLDKACVAATAGSALAAFGQLWGVFRSEPSGVEIDPMAKAIVARDRKELIQLLAKSDAAPDGIRIARDALPWEVVRRPAESIGLLELAAAVGGKPLGYLLDVVGLPATVETLHEAVASGNPKTIQRLWRRVSEAELLRALSELTKTAVNYHRVDIAKWLLTNARAETLRRVRDFAAETLALDVLARLPQLRRQTGSVRLEGLLGENADALTSLGLRLETAELIFDSVRDCLDEVEFSRSVKGLAPTLLVAVSRNGFVFGARVALPWPQAGEEAVSDEPGETFQFTVTDGEAVRYPLEKAELRCVDEEICVADLVLTLTLFGTKYEHEAWDLRGGAGETPRVFGLVERWECWSLREEAERLPCLAALGPI